MDIEEISWDHYRTLLAVLDTGSLSAAARSLGLTQPTAGRHIEALEQAFGAALFLRGPQGLLPTEKARAMHGHARSMAAMSASLARIASGDMDGVRGTVRVSASEVIAIEALPKILAELQDRHPGLEIELSASDTVEDLLNQEADIAVRMTTPRQNALLSRHIGRLPMGFFAHRRYLEKYGQPTDLPGLSNHRLIGFDRQLAYIREILKDNPVVADLRFQFRADSNLAQLAAIRAGIGIGVCQVALGRTDPDLVEVLPGRIDLGLETYVVMHESLKTTPRYRTTFDALVAGLFDFAGRRGGGAAAEA
ncbi:LysR family transcriptional regulator [Rhizobium sp. Root274]|uniref:LysR family transcriptional regulator n=1 Tax=unclassified Rhizobium TaxID=2613769 RepID=UPI000714893D|nr:MULTISPECIES: LysR family transcriptional regulator [unclassified Rhizobium]KQW28944.1 LysR family transcriptional regulator [Rhizobium sp. Root1240]KRD29140.1 LysR family transcriptional regulator [Rhizobium sp. Root274]